MHVIFVRSFPWQHRHFIYKRKIGFFCLSPLKMTHVAVASKANAVHRRRRIHVEIKKQINDDALMASSSGDLAWLEQALRSNYKKAVIQTKEQGFSPIHLAAMNGHLDCLKVLIEKQRVPVNYESHVGWRAVHLAINNKNKIKSLKCLDYLLEQGADPSKPNHNGFTPVHKAATAGHINCLLSLIEAGAIINTHDSEGLLPVDYARIWGHRTCVRILDARQWHIDKDCELQHKVKLEKESHNMQGELQKLSVEVKAHNVEKNKAAFESWLLTKGLPDQLACHEPFSTKVVEHKPLIRTKNSPSPILPNVHTTGIMANAIPDAPVVDSKLYFYQYFDEFDAEKKLDLIPLASTSASKRKQRAQDTFKAMRDAGSHHL